MTNKKIKSSDISFVVQGAIDIVETKKNLLSIQKYFPESKIILSTWEGSDVSDLKFDEVIFSVDPGFYYYSKQKGAKTNNLNRQLISTQAGLEKVKTPYVFKLRTDFELTGADFLDYFGIYDKKMPTHQVFQERILACCYFTRNPRKNNPFPYHPSDLAFFGKTKDIRNLYTVPLMTREDAYWVGNPFLRNKFTPEQHIFIHCLENNNMPVHCNFYNDCSGTNIEDSDKYFTANFIFLSFSQLCIHSEKKHFSMKHDINNFHDCYTFYDWIKLYKQYVDNDVALPLRDNERKEINKYKRYNKFFRFIANSITILIPIKEQRRKFRKALMNYLINLS